MRFFLSTLLSLLFLCSACGTVGTSSADGTPAENNTSFTQDYYYKNFSALPLGNSGDGIYYFVSADGSTLYKYSDDIAEVGSVLLSDASPVVDYVLNASIDQFVIKTAQLNNSLTTYQLSAYTLSGELLWTEPVSENSKIVSNGECWVYCSNGELTSFDRDHNIITSFVFPYSTYTLSAVDDHRIYAHIYENGTWYTNVFDWSGNLISRTETIALTQQTILATTSEGAIVLAPADSGSSYLDYEVYMYSPTHVISKVQSIELPVDENNIHYQLTAATTYNDEYFVFATVLNSNGVIIDNVVFHISENYNVTKTERITLPEDYYICKAITTNNSLLLFATFDTYGHPQLSTAPKEPIIVITQEINN